MSFFGGKTVLSVDIRDTERILNLLLHFSISYELLTREAELFVFAVSDRDASRLARECEKREIALSVRGKRGFPTLFSRLGKRIGLLLGIFCLVVILFCSSRVVWEIRVTGNQALETEEICRMLAECGLEKGTYLPELNVDSVEGQMLIKNGALCWVSVNIRGTTANVEVLETVRADEKSREQANLVAARDGRIERIEVFDGQVNVAIGDVVRAGDLLASGVYDRSRVTRAEGAVYARTVHEFDLSVSLEGIKKVYTGREWTEKYAIFFSKRIKVFTNSRNASAECDIIYRDNGVSLPDGTSLPIGLHSVIYREYREEPFVLDGETAMEQAFSELSLLLGRFVTETGAELLSKTVSCEMTEGAFRIHCTVVCIENIAITKEFEIQ